MENEGIPFDFEKSEEDKSELIYHLIEKVLGESFHEIELDAKCLRYTFKQEEQKPKPKKQTETNNSQNKKPWWKIW